MGLWQVREQQARASLCFLTLNNFSGMPTVDGLRRALQRVNAHPDGNNWVYWTSLREVSYAAQSFSDAGGC